MGEEKAPQVAVERISELKDTNEVKLLKISEGKAQFIFIHVHLTNELSRNRSILMHLTEQLCFELVKVSQDLVDFCMEHQGTVRKSFELVLNYFCTQRFIAYFSLYIMQLYMIFIRLIINLMH